MEAARFCLQLLMGAVTGTALCSCTVWALEAGERSTGESCVMICVSWMASEGQSHPPALVTFRYVLHKFLHILGPCPASLSQLLQAWSGI